jgi:hypothetical protein
MKIKLVIPTQAGYLTGDELKNKLTEMGFKMPGYIRYSPISLPPRPTCPQGETLENVNTWKKYENDLMMVKLRNKYLKAKYHLEMAQFQELLQNTFVMAVYTQRGKLPDGRKNWVYAIEATNYKWSTAAIQLNGKDIDYLCFKNIGY